jgi:hypothetical protein
LCKLFCDIGLLESCEFFLVQYFVCFVGTFI